MSGYQTYLRLQRIEDHAKKLGFRLGNPKHGYTGSDSFELAALYAADDQLPVFARDAELFVGSFDEVAVWLNGWEKAQLYDSMLRLTDVKRRRLFEEKEKERQRLEEERQAKRKTFAILSNKSESEVDKKM